MKWGICGLAAIVLLLILVVGFLFISLDRLVVEGVNRVGPEVTGSRVVLDSAALKPWNGAGHLTGLVIGNPDGFGDENLFSLGEIELDLDISSLNTDVVVIDLLRIDSPELLYLNNGETDNLRALLQQIERRMGGGGDTQEQGGAAKKIIIDEFVFTGGRAQASHALLGDQRVDLPLPELRLTGIGRETSGATVRQAAEQIFEQLNAAIRSFINQSSLYEQAMLAAEERFREEIEQVEEIRQEIENAEDQLRDAENQIRGLLDGF